METNKKIALVTGGSRGLGRDMALNIAKEGLNVIITYHSKIDEAAEVVAEIEKFGGKSVALQLNTSDVKSFGEFFTKLEAVLEETFNTNKFDFLVNNAGIGHNALFADTSEEAFDEQLNIHFKGVFFLTQKSLSHLNNGGGIVNISTGLTRFFGSGFSAYASVKGAVETMTKYQAAELGSRGIRVNIVAPGAIETDFGGGLVRDNAQVNQHLASLTALGRVGRPDDIGSVVAFLCTDKAKWINAQRIEVSGGVNI
jgi:NAD(P)-dependent dehydrogenase (short-subunit alcohol dehydrogenase family)